MNIISYVLIFIYLSFLLYNMTMPQINKSQKMLLTKKFKLGDIVITSSKIQGTIANILEHTLIIDTPEGLKIEILKTSVMQIRND